MPLTRLGAAAPASAALVPVPLQEFISDHANGRVWNAYNQTQDAAGPGIFGSPSAVVYGPQELIQVYGQGVNGDLVEYVNDGVGGRVWNSYDLSVVAGSGASGGSPDALVDAASGFVQVYARAANGDLVEYLNDGVGGRAWNAYDLSVSAGGGGPVGGNPNALYDTAQGLVHVYAPAANGDLVEYVNDGVGGRAWNAYDLSASAGGGGPVGGNPNALYDTAQGLVHVYARTVTGDLVEYVNDGAQGHLWNAYDLSVYAGGGGPVGGNPDALYHPVQGLIHLYVQGANGDLVEYVNDGAGGRVWNAYDLSVYAGAGTFVAGTPDALYMASQGLVHVYVRGANNDLVEYVNDGAQGHLWNAYDLSFATYGPTVGTDPSAVDWGGLAHVYVGGPTPMGGSVLFNLSDLPNSPYPPGSKVVALSFDDGPSPVYTPQILGILKAYRAPASFEIIGSEGAADPAQLQQEAAGGFALVNHTWEHVDLATQSPAGWVGEVDATDNLIASVTHRSVSCLRPPYGYTNGAVVSQLAQRGLGELMWDVDPSDYLRPGASVIAQRVLSALQPGAIIVMHDGGGDRSQTVAALPAIINGIRSAGYSIVEACG
ncbi:MAG TPA: polysaccharide deacetylase family protein [Acidimicrobiales bacterium]|nr:polysaccharide deacetylase family protein [Acidimicrobiales bacterium]